MKEKLFFAFLFFLGLVFGCKGADTLSCKTYGQPVYPSQFNETGYLINGVVQDYNGCNLNPSMIIIIVDPVTCQPLTTCDHNFGQSNVFTLTAGNCTSFVGTGTCRNRPESYFIYRLNDTTQVNSMIHLVDSVTSGYFILAYTWLTYDYSSMLHFSSFKNVFINLGATAIAAIPDTVPYIFFGKKGTVSSVGEAVGTHKDDTLSLVGVLDCSVISAMNELSGADLPGMFPNPSNGIFFLHNQFLNDRIENVFIADVVGRVVYENQDFPKDINLASAPPGIYFYHLKSENGKIFQGKLIKQ